MLREKLVCAFSMVVTLLSCAGTAPTSAAERDQLTEPSAEYRIGVEDVLDVSVWNYAELQRTVPVRPDGKISLPLINDVVAAGLTPMELRDVLDEKLSLYVQNPDVSVVVREIRSRKVSVIGNVRTPGRYDLRGPSTVLDALALAEGINEFAARRKITVLRRNGEDQERLRFDYDAAVKNGENNFLIQPGDIIIVP